MSRIKPSNRPHPLRVFVSHSGSLADAGFARELSRLLSQRLDARVFTADDLNAGENWQVKLRNELAEADVVLALLPPNAINSSWILQEIGAAWALEKLIIPVVTNRDVLHKLPLSLGGSDALEFRDVDTPEKADEFVQQFQDSLAAPHAR
jgi:TIR domain